MAHGGQAYWPRPSPGGGRSTTIRVDAGSALAGVLGCSSTTAGGLYTPGPEPAREAPVSAAPPPVKWAPPVHLDRKPRGRFARTQVDVWATRPDSSVHSPGPDGYLVCPAAAWPLAFVHVVTVAASLHESRDVRLLERCADATRQLKEQVARVIVGQDQVVDALLVTLLARGHALLVGVPGLAKTLLVSTVARALSLSFGRVQFTPDLLPADITGTDVLNEVDAGGGLVRREVRFMRGPIFENLVLADEINRTPPKTQAALLQAMQERHVTAGGVTHELPDPFQVFATRNPIEQEGTYQLPEAQLDRFLLEVHVGYPSEPEEREIARRTTSGPAAEVEAVLDLEEIRELGALVPRIPATDEAIDLAVRLARASRPGQPSAPAEVQQYVRFGAGPRGSQALVLAAKARAALRGEAVADVQDVVALILPALRHRLVLSYRAEADGVRDVDVLKAIRKKLRV
jgi:MoxR-like ATPase